MQFSARLHPERENIWQVVGKIIYHEITIWLYFVGMEGGTDCYCGGTYASAVIRSESECATSCPG